MAKKKFKMALPFQADPLFEERRRLENESWHLLYRTTLIRKQIEVAYFLEHNASNEVIRNRAIQEKPRLRAELASTEMKMARVNAAIHKLNIEVRKRKQNWKTRMKNIEAHELKFFENNSAPCSHCAYFDKSQLKCVFPEEKSKECKSEQGTEKGWNTLEYVTK